MYYTIQNFTKDNIDKQATDIIHFVLL